MSFEKIILLGDFPKEMKENDINPVDNKNEDFSDGYKTGYNRALRICKEKINNNF
jgi:hypothetical protein